MYESDLDEKWEQSQRPPFVTYILCGLCAVMFLLEFRPAMSGGRGMVYPGFVDGLSLARGQYWGLLTCFFLHGNFTHIAFNLYWLYRFGTEIESLLGWWRFLFFWVVATTVASLGEYLFMGSTGIGASGFVYALFGFAWVGGETSPALRALVDPQTAAIFILWLIGCFILTWMDVWAVANGAHLGGLIFGVACAYAFVVRDDVRLKGALVAVTLVFFGLVFYSPWLSVWNLAKAVNAFDHLQFEKTLGYLDHVRAPEYEIYSLELRTRSLVLLDRAAEAAPLFHDLLSSSYDQSEVDTAYAYNEYAWILATSPDEKVRQSDDAIHYAKLACEADSYKEAATLDTLAAAYASAGQFDEAVRWEKKAIEANAAGPQDKQLEANLQLFQAHQPVREKAGN